MLWGPVGVLAKGLPWSLLSLGGRPLQVEHFLTLSNSLSDSPTRSFDQKMFDFHGNCEYVLARGKMSRTDTFAVIVR